MGKKQTISTLVTGGEANAGPPLGPALGPLGVNILAVVNEINEKTKDYAGMKVPVKVEVDPDTKQFTVEVGVPPTAMLILKEANVQKGSGTPNKTFVGDVSIDSIIKVAKLKMDDIYARTIKSAVKEILGACVSIGVKVDGKPPKEVIKEVNEGKYDDKFQ
jgi:large subunit ribosomal protein L11